MKSSVDVLVCGAGAAGLALAIELARRGVSFRLIEKREGPFPGSRGKGIQPRTQEIFEDMGIIDRLVAVGGAYPPHRTYLAQGGHVDSDVAAWAPATPEEPYQMPLMVPQFLTETVMAERLAELGHRPGYGLELVGLQQDAGGVTATVAGEGKEHRIRARYLVGSDGGRSFVRNALGIAFPGKTLGVRAIVADMHLVGLDRDAWHQFGAESMDRMLSLCPLAGTDMFQLQAPIPPEGEADLSAAGLNAMIAERTGRADIRIESVSWASAYAMNARLADRYRQGRVFLAGDAAHTHPPTGGQGLNTSIQDAYNLGWKLAAVLGGAPDGLLDSYEEERRPIASDMLGLSTRLLEDAKRGGRQRGREVKQLDIGYAGSSLAVEAPARGHGLKAGDRAPDALLRGAAGQPRRLFDLFAGPHWTLLGHRADRASVPARAGVRVHAIGPDGDLFDESGRFAEAYAVAPGDWVLVRPDGYVGAIVASDRMGALEGLFRRVGIAA
ncbi:FAD-dependent oxidoreductase [[Pseudomonas] boreopolis]|uniref:FAD-dependent oxidoreductase n=1 Tax=Xanthomonas boreopolis TaxID=86183 RepID=UPI003DA16DB5